MKSEKEKLAAKSVEQLKAAYKRMGGKLVNPDGKAKTKQSLINGIVMKNRLAGKSMGSNAKPTTAKAKTTNAKDLNIKIRENKAELKKLAANIKIFEQGIAALKKRLSL
jgi:ribosomal protein L29